MGVLRRTQMPLSIGTGQPIPSPSWPTFWVAERSQFANIARLVDADAIRPVIDPVFAFDDPPAAMARVDLGGNALSPTPQYHSEEGYEQHTQTATPRLRYQTESLTVETGNRSVRFSQ